MKRLALVITLFLGAVTSLWAQNKPASDVKPNENALVVSAQQETDKLDKTVHLTAEQKKQIQELNFSMARRTEMVKSLKPEDQKTVLAQIESNRVNIYAQVLTPEQMNKYKQSLQKK